MTGATLVVDGREGDVDADGEGYFLRPTLFDHVTKAMSIYKKPLNDWFRKWKKHQPNYKVKLH